MRTIISYIIHLFSDFDNRGKFQILEVDVARGHILIEDRSCPRCKYKITVCEANNAG